MAQAEPLVVLLAGASGFIGGCALEALLDAPDVGRVIAVTRRPLKREHPRLANRIVPFERLEQQLTGLTCHAAVCCVGAPPGARDPAALRAAELDVPLAFARVARAAHAQRFVLVSVAGAARGARSVRAQLKGELEEAVGALGFGAVDILQPGPVVGLRDSPTLSELVRLAVLPLLAPLLTGRREVLRAVPRRKLGLAVCGALRSGRRGVQRYTHPGILALAALKAARTTAPPQGAAGGAPGTR